MLHNNFDDFDDYDKCDSEQDDCHDTNHLAKLNMSNNYSIKRLPMSSKSYESYENLGFTLLELSRDKRPKLERKDADTGEVIEVTPPYRDTQSYCIVPNKVTFKKFDAYLMIIDVDVKKGGKGLTSLAKLSLDLGLGSDYLESMAHVKTGSGGLHIYSVCDIPIQPTSKHYPDIDFQCAKMNDKVCSPYAVAGNQTIIYNKSEYKYEWIYHKPIEECTVEDDFVDLVCFDLSCAWGDLCDDKKLTKQVMGQGVVCDMVDNDDDDDFDELDKEISKLTFEDIAESTIWLNRDNYDTDLHYDDWIKIPAILQRVFGKNKETFDLFHKITKRSSKYEYSSTVEKWNNVNSSVAGVIANIPTLFYMCQNAKADIITRVLTDESADLGKKLSMKEVMETLSDSRYEKLPMLGEQHIDEIKDNLLVAKVITPFVHTGLTTGKLQRVLWKDDSDSNSDGDIVTNVANKVNENEINDERDIKPIRVDTSRGNNVVEYDDSDNLTDKRLDYVGINGKLPKYDIYGNENTPEYRQYKVHDDVYVCDVRTNRPHLSHINAVGFMPSESCSISVQYLLETDEGKKIQSLWDYMYAKSNKKARKLGKPENLLHGVNSELVKKLKTMVYPDDELYQSLNLAGCEVFPEINNVVKDFNEPRVIYQSDDGVVTINQDNITCRPNPAKVLTDEFLEGMELVEKHYESILDSKEIKDNLFSCISYIASDYTNRLQYMPLLIGKQGTGKSLVVNMLKGLVAENHYSNMDDKHLDGAFFYIPHGKRVVFMDEMSYVRQDGEFKEMITNPKISFHYKNKSEFLGDNTASYFGASNTMRAVNIDKDDRRIFPMLIDFNIQIEELDSYRYAVEKYSISNMSDYFSLLWEYMTSKEFVPMVLKYFQDRELAEGFSHLHVPKVAQAVKEEIYEAKLADKKGRYEIDEVIMTEPTSDMNDDEKTLYSLVNEEFIVRKPLEEYLRKNRAFTSNSHLHHTIVDDMEYLDGFIDSKLGRLKVKGRYYSVNVSKAYMDKFDDVQSMLAELREKIESAYDMFSEF